MKKSELKAGVAYYATSRNNGMTTWHDSIFKTHQQHKSNRYYVLIRDGEIATSYRSASQIYMTNCPTYGEDCPTHKREDRTGIQCYRTDFRLMDIRDEYWAVIKRMHEARKAKPTKDIRAERLRRIADRQRQANEAPIKEEFYRVLSQITDSYCHSFDRLGGFNPDQMQKITEALKASMPSVMAVAS